MKRPILTSILIAAVLVLFIVSFISGVAFLFTEDAIIGRVHAIINMISITIFCILISSESMDL